MQTFSMAQNWWQFLILAIASYFVGCFNFAVTISRFKKRDITQIGSGNPGTMNMTREFGLKIGLITFLCDALKGMIPTVFAYFIYRNYVFANTTFLVVDFAKYFAIVFVVVGHIYPVTMKGKGGKGIATVYGAFWASLSCENAWFILIVLGILIGIVLFILVTEWGSLGSMVGVTTFSIMQAVLFLNRYGEVAVNAYVVCAYGFIILLNFLTWFAHRANVMRLFSGEERRTSLKKMAKKKQKAEQTA